MLFCTLYIPSMSLVLLCVIVLQLPKWSNGKSSINGHVESFVGESKDITEQGALATSSVTTIPSQAVRLFNGEEEKLHRDVTLLGTADGMLHAIDDETSEKLWSVDTGGPLVSSSSSSSSSSTHSEFPTDDIKNKNGDIHEGEHHAKKNVNVLPTVDGSLFFDNGQGMRKTSVKARLLAEKAPFISEEGDMIFSSQKTSRVLGVDIDSGHITDVSSGSMTLDDKRGRVGAAKSSNLKPVGGRKPLWVGRVDYTIKAFDSLTGIERFNFSYSELTPLNAEKSAAVAESDDRKGSSGSNDNSIDFGDKSLVPLHQSNVQNVGVPLPLISTPEGTILFADRKGLSYRSMELGSAVTQAFSVSNVDQPSVKSEVGDVVAYNDYIVRPLRVGYRMTETDDEENQEGRVAIVRDLKGGGLYAIELSAESVGGVNRPNLMENGNSMLPSLDSKSSEDEEDWSNCNDSCSGVYWDENRGTLIDCANSPTCRKELRSAKAASIASLLTLLEDDEIDQLFSANGPLSGRKGLGRDVRGESKYEGMPGLLGTADVLLLRTMWLFLYAFVLFVGMYSLGYQHLLPSVVFKFINLYVSKSKDQRPLDAYPTVEEDESTTSMSVSDGREEHIEHDTSIMIDNLPMHRVGSLYVSGSVLGTGSHGTVVFLGNLNGRKVAVKRMLSQFTPAADREISLLIRSDGHPNVVRYFFRELKGDFVYLALQLCEMSLRDFISSILRSEETAKKAISDLNANTYALLKENNRMDKRLLRSLEYGDNAVSDVMRHALFQLADGLAHLHSKRIMHRDIKPHNILLAHAEEDNESLATDAVTNSSASSLRSIGRYLLKISDMGLSKQLDREGTSSCFASMHFMARVGQMDERGSTRSTHSMESANHPVGTIGWQAPELMQFRNSCKPNEFDESHHTEGEDKSAVDKSKLLRFQKVDIFSLGCVFHYVMFPGEHPFGEWYEREANIMNANLDLTHLSNVPCAYDLLRRMLSYEPQYRPSAVQVSKHPFFWRNSQRLDFLISLSDRLEQEALTSPIMQALEANATSIVGRHWDRKLHAALLEDMGKYRKYDTGSVRDCLRVIRNKKHHFAELNEEIKTILSPMPESYILYFETRFPRLFLHSVFVASKFLAKEEDFIEELSPIADLFACEVVDFAPCDDSIKTEFTETNKETIIWRGSQAALDKNVRGWWQTVDLWEMSYVDMHFKSKPRPAHLLKSSQDVKYRSRLCNHWEETGGDRCPMRKKGKCIFAHGPLELRVKESRRDKWNQNPYAPVDLRSSGGEDVFGAAREVEKMRKMEGSISEFENQSFKAGKKGSIITST